MVFQGKIGIAVEVWIDAAKTSLVVVMARPFATGKDSQVKNRTLEKQGCGTRSD
jgi:hypothetical protein